MSRYFRSSQLLFAVLTVATLGTASLQADDTARFAVFSKEQLEKCSQPWPLDSRRGLAESFRKYEGGGIYVLTYLIVPRWMIDSSGHKESGLVWGIFEPTSGNPGIGYAKLLDLPAKVVAKLRNSFGQGVLRVASGEDVAVLDDSALRSLFRRCQFNGKESPFDSPELQVVKRFTEEFLISERKWLFSPRGNGLMVFISESRQEEVALVKVAIPVANGSVLSFRVDGANRIALRDALRTLQGKEVPVTITLPVESVSALSDGFDLPEFARLLDVSLVGSKGGLIRGFTQTETSDGKIYLFGVFLRDALNATDVQVALSQGAPYRLVWRDDGGSGHIGSAQTFKVPTQESGVDASPLKFDLAVARLPTAARLRSDDIWHHEVSFGEAHISRDLPDIKERQIFFSAELKDPVDTELLFTDPVEYVRRLGSRIGRKVLGLEARDQRVFAQEMAQTDRALEALWEYLQIAQFISKEHVEVVVVKNVPSPTRRWRWVASADRLSSWVTSYLNYKIRMAGQLGTGISIREVEAPAQEDHIAHSVSILLVPQQKKENLP